MRVLRFNLQNRARVIESLKIFDNLSIEISESKSNGLSFTVACVGDRLSLTSAILSHIPSNWNYAIFVYHDSECNCDYPVLYCYEKSQL